MPTIAGSSHSVNSSVSFSDLTPGSVEIWLDLPEEIRNDKSLAPFQHLYRKQQERKISESQPNEATSLVEEVVESRAEDVPSPETAENLESILSFSEPLPGNESNSANISTDGIALKGKMRAKKYFQVYGSHFIQVVLVCSWIFLTVALLLNPENEIETLHTAVLPGQLKSHNLKSQECNEAKVLIRMTGPFKPVTSDNHTQGDVLNIWISYNDDGRKQLSTVETLVLVPSDKIDFAPSVTLTFHLGVEFGEDVIALDETNESQEKPLLQLRMTTSGNETVPLTLSYVLNPLREEDGVLYASLLLLALYILIIFDILSRPLAAMLVSSLAVATLAMCGLRPSLPELITWLDSETLLLLFSMMLLVAILADTGLFDYLAVLAFELTGGKTWPLINCLCFVTAILSTCLDNVTTVLLMTPVTIRLCEVMELNPVPVLMSMVIYSNVGGAATPVGDPPNVIIASHPDVLKEGINFTTFTLHMSVGILFVCLQTYLQLRYMYRDINELRYTVRSDVQELRQMILVWKRAAATLSSYSRDEEIVRRAIEKKVEKLLGMLKRREAEGGRSNTSLYHETLKQIKLKYRIRDKTLLVKSVICVSFVVVMFFLHAHPLLQRLSLGWIALLGALLLLLLSQYENLEPILSRVEWSTLLFFSALFVLIEALAKLGLIAWIGKLTENIIVSVDESSQLAVAILLVLWVSGLASAFVDNIPLTTMMVRVATSISANLKLPLAPILWALSFGACLGGNGTLIGASANVVCAGVAEQHGYRFTFMEFFKVGFPVMIGNLIVATGYLMLAHCVFTWH